MLKQIFKGNRCELTMPLYQFRVNGNKVYSPFNIFLIIEPSPKCWYCWCLIQLLYTVHFSELVDKLFKLRVALNTQFCYKNFSPNDTSYNSVFFSCLTIKVLNCIRLRLHPLLNKFNNFENYAIQCSIYSTKNMLTVKPAWTIF